MDSQIKVSDREFIEGYKVYFEQAKLGFIHGMQPATMSGFENIYRTYLDKHFNLTVWCSACVVDMMQRIARWYEQELINEEERREQELLATQAGMDNVTAFPQVLDEIKPAEEVRWAYVEPPSRKRGRPRKA